MIVCGLPALVSAEVLKLAWPLALTVIGPAHVVPGMAQGPPSMNVTLPTGTGLPPLVTVAVKVTDWPNVEGFRLDVTVVVVLAALMTWSTLPLLEFRSPLPL